MSLSSTNHDALFASIVDDVRGQDHESAFAEAERRARVPDHPETRSVWGTIFLGAVLSGLLAIGLGAILAPRILSIDTAREAVHALAGVDGTMVLGALALVVAAVFVLSLGSLLRNDG